MAKTNTAVAKQLSEEQLATLNEGYPIADESTGMKLPRLGMLAKDITEETGTGKNKKINVIQAAGTFFTEADEGEVNEETGKSVWTRTYIEDAEIDVMIVYHRRQLRRFDSGLEKFYSTPLFDNAEQIVPLYLDGKVIKRGNQATLQALWPKVSQKGFPTSDLKEEAILFVVYNENLYQLNLSQSSKWQFKTYKKNMNPSTVITTISGIEDTFGDNTFMKIKFVKARAINAEEFETVRDNQDKVREQVQQDEKFYLGAANTEVKDENDMNAYQATAKELPAGSKKGEF